MKLYHKDATGCSWGGENFEPDEDGAFDIPEEAVVDLVAHGFTTDPAVEPDEAPAKVTGRRAKKATEPAE